MSIINKTAKINIGELVKILAAIAAIMTCTLTYMKFFKEKDSSPPPENSSSSTLISSSSVSSSSEELKQDIKSANSNSKIEKKQKSTELKTASEEEARKFMKETGNSMENDNGMLDKKNKDDINEKSSNFLKRKAHLFNGEKK